MVLFGALPLLRRMMGKLCRGIGRVVANIRFLGFLDAECRSQS
ncbi:hypothetical protein METHB2_10108 [Candidatus Methylobacter favarea]|uniref:Uncharacterized protein n=1 Tax=Candidatus Methylobacter favarea TaxID=2707345 RepID=A0A8S0Y5K2_9GAMM|nr:hypothetical protein METHB2_10108 [Candidatus Methylobacter favarea]